MADELVGQTLAEYLAGHERLPLGEALALLDALLLLVGQAHRTDTADGALNEGRVLVTGFGQLKLLPVAESVRPANADAYLSPQLLEGQAPDARADVYALGVLAYRMLMGIVPYASGEQEPADPKNLLPNLVDRVCRSLTIAVQRNLTERFGDALTFRAALRGESAVALDTPTLRWAVAEGIPEGDTGAADEFAGGEASADEGDSGGEVAPGE